MPIQTFIAEEVWFCRIAREASIYGMRLEADAAITSAAIAQEVVACGRTAISVREALTTDFTQVKESNGGNAERHHCALNPVITLP